MLHGEDKLPLACMGLVDDYNSVQVEKLSDFISISTSKYMNRVLKTHTLDKPSPHEATSSSELQFGPSKQCTYGTKTVDVACLQST